MTFRAEADFEGDPSWQLRRALIEPDGNDAYRMIHGGSDQRAGWYVDRLGSFLLSQGEAEVNPEQEEELLRMPGTKPLGIYHKRLVRRAGNAAKGEAAPTLLRGAVAPERFVVTENGLRFEASFNEGYSVGIFLDQRDNRRRLLTGHIGAEFLLYSIGEEKPEVLNTFAYTCAFSVCAARAGARVTSLDLSKKYLEWGKRNFELNELRPEEHDFIYGDVFDWMPRLAKKGRRFDLVLIDPPTFSQSKKAGAFRVEKDYSRLIQNALPLLKPNGVLFCSTNASNWQPESFLAQVRGEIARAGRRIAQEKYFPQPPDFPLSREEPGYLKTVWMRLD